MAALYVSTVKSCEIIRDCLTTVNMSDNTNLYVDRQMYADMIVWAEFSDVYT